MNTLKQLNNRQQWIATAAYYKAEARGFVQGKEAESWQAAENEYIDSNIKLITEIQKMTHHRPLFPFNK